MNSKSGNSTNFNKGVFGIHHVTAITKDPQANVDFYTDIVGLRLVKLTVNQDDPTSYHLYYGDELDVPVLFLLFFIGLIHRVDKEERVRLVQHLF